MKRMDRNEKLLNKIVIGAFATGIILASFGVYLTFVDETPKRTIANLLGQSIESDSVGVIAIFIGAVLIVFLVKKVLTIISESEKMQDNLLTLFQKFQNGTKSPHENASLIELIANANNPNKRDYLQQAKCIDSLSFMEVDAINMALSDIDENKSVMNLLDRCRSKELKKINEVVPDTQDPLFKPLVSAIKYTRYVSRKDTPSYDKMNAFLAECLAHKDFTDNAMNLSKELESELRAFENIKDT
ncbi:hypothetical protein [Vibrio parahaemolyticus]|uniref:hypothetical protein n=1 Tax=Vibrio parahaemolyticus TaxID=670 RepID=UPI002361249F|nr:hypothetical protein [Vibrio parahaemolyticus]